MGCFVGAVVGLVVGNSDGPPVGCFVGAVVGLVVGNSVGLPVGCFVGEIVGLVVGNSVGPPVGCCVGAVVGFTLGFTVGPFVGILDGTSVGFLEGSRVGASMESFQNRIKCKLRYNIKKSSQCKSQGKFVVLYLPAKVSRKGNPWKGQCIEVFSKLLRLAQT